jgi:hypothetical protein
VVSDGGGATAEAAVGAATVQFPGVDFAVLRRPGIRAREQVLEVVREASNGRAIVVHTMVIQELRSLLVRECRLRLIPQFDLIGPLISHISQEVGLRPILQPGAARELDAAYFRRIDAIQFTVQHDDGQAIETIGEADIILVGVSRSSKTPLSIFLSMLGWRVANVPIILGVAPPPRLDEVEQAKIVALTIKVEQLVQMRRARLQLLERPETGDYADPELVREELAYLRQVIRRGYPWPAVDITNKSIEESAKEVIALVESQRPSGGEDSPPRRSRVVLPRDEFKP